MTTWVDRQFSRSHPWRGWVDVPKVPPRSWQDPSGLWPRVPLIDAVSPPVVYRPTKGIREVTNLGWLLRHWQEVEQVELREVGGVPFDGYLIAYLLGGVVYVTRFYQFAVARDWLDRPVFRGLPLLDCGTITTCGAGGDV